MMLCTATTLVDVFFFFFFNDTATTEIYTLSLHDALPICRRRRDRLRPPHHPRPHLARRARGGRSEEHTSELQSRENLVCRLLLEKKKKKKKKHISKQKKKKKKEKSYKNQNKK